MQHDRFKSRSLVHEAWRNGHSEAARPTALITGASRGIGRALAEEFAKNDHDLILIARNAADLENCAAELAETYSVAVRPLAVDLASPDAVETIVAFLNAHNLQVDVLINNAALWTAGPSYTCDTRDTDTVIATNTALPQALTRALVEPMIVRGYGALLNVGSLAGEMPSPGLAIYGASKSFLRYWTLSLRHELKTYNIHVSLLLPGLVNTDFTKGFSTNRWNTLRSILACRPETVAVAGYRGLVCNRAIVVPGGIARISYLALKFMPRKLAVSMRAIGYSSSPTNVDHRDGISAKVQGWIANYFATGLSWLYHFVTTHKIVSIALLFLLMTMLSASVAFNKLNSKTTDFDRVNAYVVLHLLEERNKRISAQAREEPASPYRRLNKADRQLGYGLVLYAIIQIDERVRNGLSCLLKQQRCNADISYTSLVSIQLFVAMLGMLFVFIAALLLSNSWPVAVVTLLIVFIASRIGDYAGLLLFLVWLPTFTLMFVMSMLIAFRYRSLAASFCAGGAAIITALFLPSAIVLAPVSAALFLGMAILTQQRQFALCGLAVAIGASAVGAGALWWLLDIYTADALVEPFLIAFAERAGFNEISLKSWAAGMIVPLPYLDRLADVIFTKEIANQHGSWWPGTFTYIGKEQYYSRPMAVAGATATETFMALIYTKAILEPLKYIAVTPVILNRGLWVEGTVLAGIGMLHLREAWVYQRFDGRMAMAIVALAPVVVLLMTNTMLTANHAFCNPGLIFIYAYSIALVLARH